MTSPGSSPRGFCTFYSPLSSLVYISAFPLTSTADHSSHGLSLRPIPEQSHTPPAFRLPLCYLMDSILQNIRGQYIPLFSRYAVAMCCRTYEEGSDRDRQCISKLLRLWRERQVFEAAVLDPIDVHLARIERVGREKASGTRAMAVTGHAGVGVGEKRCVGSRPA